MKQKARLIKAKQKPKGVDPDTNYEFPEVFYLEEVQYYFGEIYKHAGTYKEAAQVLNLNPSFISQVRRGKSGIGRKTLSRISERTGISINRRWEFSQK